MKSAESPKRARQSRRGARLTAVSFLTDAVNRSLDLREIADNALDSILAVMKLDAGAVYVSEEGNQSARLCASRGLPDEIAQALSQIRRGENAAVDAVLDDNTRVVEDLALATGKFRVDLVQAGFRSGVAVPIHARGTVVGLLALGSSRARRFETEDVDLVQVIANQIGVALANAQLLSDLREKNALLQLLIEEAHHRIKNNLQMISGLLQLEAESTRQPECREHLQTAVSRIQAIAHVHNLLSEEMPKQVNVERLISTIVNSLVRAAPRPGESPHLRLNLEPVSLSAEQAVALALIVNELVANALMHGQPKDGSPLQLSVCCQQQADTFYLGISDNGGGLRSNQGESAEQGQGLSIVRQLAKVNLRGALEVWDCDDGVYAELRFPV